MIDDIRQQSSKTILDYLKRQGADRHCNCYYNQGLEPLLHDQKVYIYATEGEVVIVALDPDSSHMVELADEEGFDSKPLYFTENSHRVSPVWNLAVTCKALERRLSCPDRPATRVWGLLLTGSHLINYDDMTEVWNRLNVCVIDRMDGLDRFPSEVSLSALLDGAFSQAHFCEWDCQEDEIKEAEETLRRLHGTETLDGDDANDEEDEEDVGLKPVFDWDAFEPDTDAAGYDSKDDVLCILPSQASDDGHRYWDAVSNGMMNRDTLMQHVASVQLIISTYRKPSLYASGTATVILHTEEGSRLAGDRFRCFIYTNEFFQMCSSVADTKVRHSKGGGLRIKMDCGRIWLPGEYILLVEDRHEMVARYDFTLDEHLVAVLGEVEACPPCGREEILAACLDTCEDWSRLACFPGAAQLRRHAIRYRQLDVYNTYRISRGGMPVESDGNLLISTRNGDFDEQFLKVLFSLSAPCGLHFAYTDCSRLYDAAKPNPYEYLNDEFSSWKKSVLCLTGIGPLLNAGGKTIVRKIVDMMRDRERENRLWICDTPQKLEALLTMYPSLGGFFLRGSRLEQEPYSAFDLVQAFRDSLRKESLEVTPEVTDALARAILQGQRQGVFGNWSIESLRRFVIEEIRPRYLERALSDILSEELPPLSMEDLCLDQLTRSTSSFDESMRELNQMIGLDSVKEGIRTMANNARLYIERRRRGLKTSDDMVFHSIFTGNPGTGKTTVARMLGRIYHSLGLLSKGEVVAVDRTRLVGQYIGQTEENMKVILEEARGNVLFIDEAYTLYIGADDSKDFGMRVIESLMTVLSQPSPDMLVVFAGYPVEMDNLLSANPGLSGRFPYRYLFPDYDAEQLIQIARRLFEHDDYILTDEAVSVLKEVIDETLRKHQKNFSNARWMEQLVRNGIIPALADRVFSTSSDDFQHVEAADVRTAYDKLTPKSVSQKPHHKVVAGFLA